jgi:hypothetical protein
VDHECGHHDRAPHDPGRVGNRPSKLMAGPDRNLRFGAARMAGAEEQAALKAGRPVQRAADFRAKSIDR